MNNGTLGFCKYPGNSEMQDYINSMKKLYEEKPQFSGCHTLDRENFHALAECGTLNETKLAAVIESYTRFNHWSVS